MVNTDKIKKIVGIKKKKELLDKVCNKLVT